MNHHINMVDNHQALKGVQQVEEILSTITQKKDIPDSAQEKILRVEYVINNFKEAMASSDRLLISDTWLNAINTALNQIRTNLVSYNNNYNATHLNNATFQLNVILENTAKINTTRSKLNLSGIMSSVKKYQNSVSEYLNSIKKRNAQLETEGKKLAEQFASLEQEMQETTNDFKGAVAQEKIRLDSLVTDYQAQIAEKHRIFQEQQGKFSGEFEANQKENTALFTQQQHEVEERIDAMYLNFEEKLNKQISDAGMLVIATKETLDKHKKDIEQTVELISSSVFSNEYRMVADNAHKRAKFWHRLAFASIIVLVCFALYSFGVILDPSTTWVQLVARIFATTTIATGSVYAARQASKQEIVERYAREIALKTSSIDPFLASLEEEQRQEVKQEIARSIFGKSDLMELSAKGDTEAAVGKALSIDDVIKLLGKLK